MPGKLKPCGGRRMRGFKEKLTDHQQNTQQSAAKKWGHHTHIYTQCVLPSKADEGLTELGVGKKPPKLSEESARGRIMEMQQQNVPKTSTEKPRGQHGRGMGRKLLSGGGKITGGEALYGC